MLESYRELRALASDNRHIVPGHDPQVMRRYPAPTPELKNVVVRLDVPPEDANF